MASSENTVYAEYRIGEPIAERTIAVKTGLRDITTVLSGKISPVCATSVLNLFRGIGTTIGRETVSLLNCEEIDLAPLPGAANIRLLFIHTVYTEGETMGVLPDWQIQRDVKIEPFEPARYRPGVISYGVTSYGYDVRVGRKFKVFTNVRCTVVDPKNFDPGSFVDLDADYCLIPPNSFALAETVEYLEIPRDILAICIGKSTYARIGIIVNITPLEPEWRGKITIEISNTTPLPAKIYAGEGIAQIVFFRAEAVCNVSYADKKGKYQDQKGLTLPFVQG